MKACAIHDGVTMEACQPTGEWYPVQIIRRHNELHLPLLSKSDPMFWVLITYPDRTTARGLRMASEIRLPTSTGATDDRPQ